MIKFIKSLFRKIVSYWYNTGNKTLTIDYSDGSKEQYVWECTVWNKLPSFKRCSTSTESWLCDLYTELKYHENR